MSRRRVNILDRGATFVCRGWQMGELLKEAGIQAPWNGVAAGHVGDARRLADLVAYLSYRNIAFEVVPETDDAA
jgi:hypothetical protein